MTSNDDLMERLTMLEDKVDRLTARMEQANGAWFFIKIMGSIAVGIVVVWNGIQGWFK